MQYDGDTPSDAQLHGPDAWEAKKAHKENLDVTDVVML